MIDQIKKSSIILFSIFGIIICQGNAWAQVVSCRINASIYETLIENKNEILESNTIIIDQDSFARNIKHSLIYRDFNILHTYYGAQTLESNGLAGMIYLLESNSNKNIRIFISTKSPIKINKNELKFAVQIGDDYRKINEKVMILKNNDIFILDYNLVYGDGYDFGRKI